MLRNFYFCLLLLSAIFSENALYAQTSAVKINTNIPPWENLTIRQKIGQTVVALMDFEVAYRKHHEPLDSVLDRYPVGAIFMANWLIKGGADSAQSVIQKKIIAYAENAKIPILFQEDYENGLGDNITGFTKMPNMMALGATNNESLAWKFGNTISSEARQLGINWMLNPVCDLNLNFLNPLISTRSLSDDPEKIIRLVSQQLKAMQKNGVAATIKHFPGDGVDFRDQHQVTTVNSLSRKDWNRTYGKVFQSLIDSGVDCVMAGHISLPAYQTKTDDGNYLPASLSKELITNLLKGDLGFKGVVVTDALNMGGMAGYYPSPLETQIASFKAGCDMMLWPVPEYIDTLEARIIKGTIPITRLNDAVQRVWELKRKCGLWDKNFKPFSNPVADAKINGQKVATQIAESSITLVRDLNVQLPLDARKSKKVLWIIVGTKSKSDALIHTFQTSKKELEKLGFQVEMRVNCPYYGIDINMMNTYDKIILALDHHSHDPMGTVQLYEDEILTIWTAQMLPKDKVISISYGDPYCQNTYLPLIKTCINAYSASDVSQQAVIRAISGAMTFRGISPVNLNIHHTSLY